MRVTPVITLILSATVAASAGWLDDAKIQLNKFSKAEDGSTFKDAQKQATAKADELKKQANAKADELNKRAKAKADELKKQALDKAKEVKNRAEEAQKAAAEKARSLKSQAKDKAASLQAQAKDILENASPRDTDAAKKKSSSLQQQAKDLIDNATKQASALKNNAKKAPKDAQKEFKGSSFGPLDKLKEIFEFE